MQKPRVPYVDTMVAVLVLGIFLTSGMSFCAALLAMSEANWVGAGLALLATGVPLAMLLNALLRS